MTRRWFWLYRPTAPSTRAQSIQVVQMCHAVALTGVRVTLCVDPPIIGPRPTVLSLLSAYGLSPTPQLSITVLPSSPTLASLWFRCRVIAFALRWGRSGLFYSRSKRYTQFVQRLWFCSTSIVQEVHEVDSAQQKEAGQPHQVMFARESLLFQRVVGVVANCPGTGALLAEVHDRLPPILCAHNATHIDRVRKAHDNGVGAGVVGSVRKYKGMSTLATAATRCTTPVTLIGASSDEEARALSESSSGSLSVETAVPYTDVPDRLSSFRTLVIPLSDGLFGARLTSPLKLWDYMASGVPIVAANLPSVMLAAPGALYPYTADDADSLAAAIDRVSTDEPLRRSLLAAAVVRTWSMRALEVVAFVDTLGESS